MSASPQAVITRFFARRTLRSATFVALALGTFVASKVIGYAAAYPTVHERLLASQLYVNNTGLIALYGPPRHLETVPGFAVWYTMFLGILISGIWAYLTATKTFRGNEDTGRWELLLAGPTSARRATAGALAGLGLSLALLYALTATAFIAVGHYHSVGFGAGDALYLALAAISGAVIFMAVGAFTSQLMPTRSRATGLATAIFGVSFLIRAAADVTNTHWLLNITPLGWIEQLQPLYDPQPIWLLPIAAFTAALVAAIIFLAGRRDLGASFFADHDTAQPHTRLLGSPLGAAIRLTRGSSLSWLIGLGAVAAFFGLLTQTAGQAFSDSPAATHMLNRLTQNTQEIGSKAFLGVVFFLLMTVLMAYAASAVTAMRGDEAQGYLDNFLVGPISRLRWLLGRTALATVLIVTLGLLTSLVVWAALANQHTGVTLHDLLRAGLNILAPAIFVLGAGLCALGLAPRFTSLIAYGVIAWSFLIQLLSSGVNLSHWLLDTSIFTHVAFAPAADPKWGNDAILAALGLGLALVGATAFNRRDLANE